MIKRTSTIEEKMVQAYTLSMQHHQSMQDQKNLAEEKEILKNQSIIDIQKDASLIDIKSLNIQSNKSIPISPNRYKTNINTPQYNPIFYSGVLQKRVSSSFWLPFWKKRYCKIQKFKFLYHQSDDPSSPQDGILNFNAVSVNLNIQFGNNSQIVSFAIIPTNTEVQFIFRSQNKDLNYKWVKLTKQAIQYSKGNKYNFVSICKEPNFWEKDYEMESQFRKNVETGDIILFKGIKTSSSLLRKFTFAQYDHVAVLLKNQRGQIIIFEAVGGTGVGILPWEKFIQKGWHKSQHIISYRKLLLNRTNKFFYMVENFVNDNIGKMYDFSLKKMFKRVSLEEDPDSIDKKSIKNNYFCSELVAALYKYINILDKRKSSTQYWPGSFEEDEEIQFIETLEYGKPRLGRQTIIVFEQNDLQILY